MATPRQALDFASMIDIVEAQHKVVQDKMDGIKERKESVSIGDMFEMQMLMNKLNQLAEMSANLMSATHSATLSFARNVRAG